MRILRSSDESAGVKRGLLRLAQCRECGFVWNAAFDPALVDYSAGYEATQAYSGVYNAFLRKQAEALVSSLDLHHKRVVEIGCGHGEFLAAVCEAGENTGLGLDPAFLPERAATISRGQFAVEARLFDRDTRLPRVDLVVCRNTLEHIADVGEFVATLRAALADQPDARVFFQVPDFGRILKEGAFWDVFYEHCSYFTADSLRVVFERNGFEVQRCEVDFGGQYLDLLAVPKASPRSGNASPGVAGASREAPKQFGAFHDSLARWRQVFETRHREGRSSVLWGGGSKAVAFLTALGLTDEVAGVVDINPHKWGTFLPLTRHRVSSPSDLHDIAPDEVLVMNPVYRGEVAQSLSELGLHPRISALA
ncbi:class I SAM-dependent methyltransferase [Maricaulis sp. CAU 1757]